MGYPRQVDRVDFGAKHRSWQIALPELSFTGVPGLWRRMDGLGKEGPLQQDFDDKTQPDGCVCVFLVTHIGQSEHRKAVQIDGMSLARLLSGADEIRPKLPKT